MGRTLLTGIVLSLLMTACGREFEAPPPAASISDFSPGHGFMDAAVGICGRNFDPVPESNLVYFGTQAAEVLPQGRPDDAAPAEDFTCDGELLWVRTPGLSQEGEVDLKVSTRYGQALSPRPFVYDGPGHPVAESLKKQIGVRAGLWSVITATDSSAGTFATIGVESNVMGIFEDQYGLHLDLGLCDTPLSAAAAVTGSLEFTLFVSHLRFLPAPDFGADVRLNRWRINMLDLAGGHIEVPQLVDPPGDTQDPFVPNQIWSFPRTEQQQSWVEHDVAVTDLNRGALAIVSTRDDSPYVIELPDQPLVCDSSRSARDVPIVDLAYDSQAQHFYLALADTNEIWRVPMDTRQPRRVYPPDSASPTYTDCAWALSSLALRKSQLAHTNLRLYAADAKALRVIEMKINNPGAGENLSPTLNLATFDSVPYDLITGRFPTVAESGVDIAGERLYVATQNGLSVLDVSDTTPLTPSIAFEPLGELPVPRNRGGSQSLARRASFDLGAQKADTILFVDSNNDQVLKITCGEESILQGDTAAGSSYAQLATSCQGDRLYLSDALSNVIHVIDRSSGLRTGQFPITGLDNHGTMGFGSVGLTTLRGSDADLVVLPLTDLEGLNNLMTPAQFRPIAYGLVGHEYPACGLTTGGLQTDDAVGEKFDQLELVTWNLGDGQEVPALVLTRFFDVVQPAGGGEPQPMPGRIWCLEIDPEPAEGEGLILGPLSACDASAFDPLGSEVQRAGAHRKFPVLVLLESARTAEGSPAIGVRLVDLSGGTSGNEGLLHLLKIDLIDEVTDLTLVPRDPAGLTIQAYLALPRLGHLLVVTFDLENQSSTARALPTGGDPSLLTASPDGRRLYATHFFGGQVSVIRTDCQPAGQCEQVEATIDVDAWPGPVTFSDSGRAAYVVHFVSGDISWIE